MRARLMIRRRRFEKDLLKKSWAISCDEIHVSGTTSGRSVRSGKSGISGKSAGLSGHTSDDSGIVSARCHKL